MWSSRSLTLVPGCRLRWRPAFEPFFTTKDVGKGTGLGLDICRRLIVDRHHGQITIDSSPDGTVLSVRLPLVLTEPTLAQWASGDPLPCRR